MQNVRGANYMVKTDELLVLAKSIGIHLMPEEIIHEEALIGAIARSSERFAKADTYATTYPISTLSDYYHNMLRVKRGYLQLESLYPDLFYDSRTRGMDSLSLAGLPRRIRQNGLLYYISRAVVKIAVHCSLRVYGAEQSTVWREISTTKLRPE